MLSILLGVSPLLLLATFLMTAKSKSFRKIFVAHFVAFLAYMFLVINFSEFITGHDEYGLGQLGLTVLLLLVHIIFGFVQGIYVVQKGQKTDRKKNGVEAEFR